MQTFDLRHFITTTDLRIPPVAIAALLGVAFIALAYFVAYPIFVMKVMCFALFAASFNLLLGYGGLMSFGHAAFFGGGAYICAHAAKVWGLTAEISILAGVAFAAALGAGMGYLAIRRHGIYFAMISLAIAQMFYFFCLQAPFTGGEDGIQGVPRAALLGLIPLRSNGAMYLFVSLVFLAGLLAIWRIINSPFGHILKAIRENEARAISLGYDVEYYKLATFVISAAMSGLAGAIKALVFQLATLADVGWVMSGEVVLMTLIGGIGTFMGPIVGAALVVGLQNFLSTSTVPVPLVLGTIFMACVILFRSGIVGELAWLWERSGKRTKLLQGSNQ